MFSVTAGIIGIISVFLIYRGQMSGIHITPETIKKAVDMSLARVHQTAMKNGIREWDLDAASAELFEKENKVILSAPEVVFFLKDGTSLSLTADTGILKTDSKAIRVAGNVKAKRDGHKLFAETLDYEPDKRTLSSDRPVRITGDRFELSADSVELDIESEKTLFKGRVKGIFGDAFKL